MRLLPLRSRIARRPVRAAIAITAALLTAAGLTGCGSDSGAGKTEITFWDNNGGPARTPIYQHLIAQFEQANPDIHVKYVGIPSASVQQKYDTAIAGGQPPDIGGVTTSYLSNLVGQDALEALDGRLAGSPLKDKLVTGLVNTVTATAADKKLYELPSSGNLDVIWYRKDLFDTAGLQAPKTWDEFFTAAGKLTDPAKKQYGYTLRGGAGSIFQLLAEMYAYSGQTGFFDASKSTVDTPKNAELVDRMSKLFKKATPAADVNNGYPQMVAEFTSGSVAMMHHNLGSSSDVKKAFGDKVAAVPLPSTDGSKSTVVANPVDGFAVFKASKHKDAAWKFAEFLVSKESNSYWNEKVGQIPANSDVESEAWIGQNAAVKDALALVRNPATTIVEAPVYLPQYSAITKADSEPLYQKVLLGQLSAADFVKQLGDKLTGAQAEWDKRHK
ncbi:MAG TPA: sugar ABC transporter substrate-binding protein [Mycobacteriales bacterium]|nr:sugar ABC transporter substrate-binding protein [Mycobacteriales bacterium]